MRIIGGKRKGLKLRAIVPEEVRPTSDRAREALFNLLSQGAWRCDWEGGNITFVDLCAGVGTVGLEALSRGAKRVTFVEKNPNVIKSLQKNIELFKIEGTEVINADSFNLGYRQTGFNLLFVDPPYGNLRVCRWLAHWKEKGWLVKGSRVIVQTDKREDHVVANQFNQSDIEGVEQRAYGRNIFISGIV